VTIKNIKGEGEGCIKQLFHGMGDNTIRGDTE
jgi:hypothetical protein